MDQHIVVVGAGLVGLSTAWHLQKRGAKVTVIDREGPAAGSSWGNAGWLSPALTVPLAEPSVLRFGLKSLVDDDSPLYMPLRLDPTLIRFGLGFARRSTLRTWNATMQHYLPLSERALEAFDEIGADLDEGTTEAPIWAAFRSEADAADLLREFDLIEKSGTDLRWEMVGGDAVRAARPVLSDEVNVGVRIDGQRFINPGRYCDALAKTVTDGGGELIIDEVEGIRKVAKGVSVACSSASVHAAHVVIATGAWLPRLAREHKVRVPLVAGRGYSFRVDVDAEQVPGPVYLPGQRVACTPLDGGLRVAGTMEFRPVDAPLDEARVDALVRSVESLIDADLSVRHDTWVGGRPVTVDGLPLVGPTRTAGVWVAGGHGMWGVTLGPLTGRLIADWMLEGRVDPALRPLDPLR